MPDKLVSPRRPRGPASAASPSVAPEHGAVDSGKNYAGSSRSSLFNLFRRQPSRADLTAPRAPQSVRSTGADSYYGAFDNISVGTTVTGLQSPHQAHETAGKTQRLLAAAANYRQSIETMSSAAAEFGSALYECADTKGAAAGQTSLPEHAVDADLQAAAGLHLLIANHVRILAASVVSNVEDPLDIEFKRYEDRIAAKEREFKATLTRKMSFLRQSDAQRQRDARKRGNLGSYRSKLLDLTYQIDDINRLKVEFLGDIHALSTELAERTHASIASLVTAEIEVAENIARKGWTGGGLDGLLAGCPDPFTKPDAVPPAAAEAPPPTSSSAVDEESHFNGSFDLDQPGSPIGTPPRPGEPVVPATILASPANEPKNESSHKSTHAESTPTGEDLVRTGSPRAASADPDVGDLSLDSVDEL